MSFNGIAMGAFGVIIAYQLMRWLSRYGVFHDGQPPVYATTVQPMAEGGAQPSELYTSLTTTTMPDPNQPVGGAQPGDPPMGAPPLEPQAHRLTYPRRPCCRALGLLTEIGMGPELVAGG